MVNFKNYGDLIIPAGTQTRKINNNHHVVNEFGWISRKYPEICNILLHDATYYGIRIDESSIEGLDTRH